MPGLAIAFLFQVMAIAPLDCNNRNGVEIYSNLLRPMLQQPVNLERDLAS